MRHLRHLGLLARRYLPDLALALFVFVVSAHIAAELGKFLGVGKQTARAPMRADGRERKAAHVEKNPLPPPPVAPAVRQTPSMAWPLPQATAVPPATLTAPKAPGAPLPQAPSMVWPLPQATAEPTTTPKAPESPGAPLPPR